MKPLIPKDGRARFAGTETDLMQSARLAVLAHFNAPPKEYVTIFTPSATGACQLVGEAYPFGPRSQLVLTHDNHNSVHGIRDFARLRGAPIRYVPFSSPELRVDDTAIRYALERPAPGRLGAAWRVARSGAAPWPGRGRKARRQRTQTGAGLMDTGPEVAVPQTATSHPRGLFAYPAQSHFSGVQHPLRWIEMAHERGFDVLLDAAAYVPFDRLDLSVAKPDFVAVGWYKVFGYPTGVGCLITRRKVLESLWRSWFSGGSAYPASAQNDRHTLAAAGARFEDGTLSFLQLPDLDFGLSRVADIGIGHIRQRVMCLTGCFIDRLVALRHSNGQPMARHLRAPQYSWPRRHGCVQPAGPFGVCNRRTRRGARHRGRRDLDRDRVLVGPRRQRGPQGSLAERGESTDPRNGAIPRLSAPAEDRGAQHLSGPGSNIQDVERVLAFLEVTYRDVVVGAAGCSLRHGC